MPTISASLSTASRGTGIEYQPSSLGELRACELAWSGEVVDAGRAPAEHSGTHRAGHAVVVDKLEGHRGIGSDRPEDPPAVEHRQERSGSHFESRV